MKKRKVPPSGKLVQGQREGLLEALGWVRHMRVGSRTACWLAALDEMELHIDCALDRLDAGMPLAGTSGFGLSNGGLSSDHSE